MTYLEGFHYEAKKINTNCYTLYFYFTVDCWISGIYHRPADFLTDHELFRLATDLDPTVSGLRQLH